MLSSAMLPAHGAGLVQAEPASQAVGPSATAQDEQLSKLDLELQSLKAADPQQVEMASYADKFNAFEQLVQQSGREGAYDKKVIAYRMHLLTLQQQKGSVNASNGRMNALPGGDVARNRADLEAGRVVCTNPAASTNGRFDRNEPYTDSWMVYVCRAERVQAKRR